MKTNAQSLAERFGLLDLPRLEAKLQLKAARDGSHADVTGLLEADVVQQCVVTLEPLQKQIAREIETHFEAGLTETEQADVEDIEPIVNGIIDLGELMAQYLGTSLDPYPRKPGAAFVEAQYGGGEVLSPFAAALKKAEKKKE